MAAVILFLLISILSSSPSLAQTIYKWKDEKGQWQFGQNPPANVAEVSPSDLKPGQTGIFRKRIFFLSDTPGYGWYSDAQWSE